MARMASSYERDFGAWAHLSLSRFTNHRPPSLSETGVEVSEVRKSRLGSRAMSPPPGSLNAKLAKVAGVKRPAPSPLLPAFDPLPSSPCLPRPAKRFHMAPSTGVDVSSHRYPTPVPTSSTGILSSSPPNLPPARPGLMRTMSSISERAPLSIVPTITLPGNGDELLMGRSSNSSHFQLSANRLISRVHVRAVFVPAATPDGQNKVEVTCLGWNGVKIHCQGRTWGLSKGDIFTSDREHDIMLDVHDARVLLSWPTPEPNRSLSGASHSTPDVDESPRSIASSQAHQLMSSPLCRGRAPESPVSPTPAGRATFPSSSTLLPSDENPATNVVSVYEDEPSPDDRGTEDGHAKPSQSTQPDTQPLFGYSGGSQSSALSEPQDFSDPDEENDPTIVSFGPQGDNLLPRIASFTTADSPIRAVSRPLRAIDATRPRSGAGLGPGLGSGSGSSATTEEEASAPLVNHVINQLAYSRLSSTPLSTVLLNLPADLRDSGSTKGGMKPVTKEELKAVLESLPCVGSVRREGKDAAGKPLESEYHYVPDMDTDEKRRDSVVNGLQKPGLRACRKQHKQYFWRKPKTP